MDADGGQARGPRQRRPIPPSQRAVRIAVLAIFWFVAVMLTFIAIGSEKIPSGTTIAGVEIGGLDRQSAINKLNASFAQQAQAPMTLKISQTTARCV